jgi:hypothetical protein
LLKPGSPQPGFFFFWEHPDWTGIQISLENEVEMIALRLQVHRANISRYEGLLACDLTPYERLYLEQMIEQERSAIRRLFAGRAGPGRTDKSGALAYGDPQPR